MISKKTKVIFTVFDGLGDRPIPELGDKTPLEAAYTPNLDKIAAEGECGAMFTVGRGITPGSDVAHLSLFGYDPRNDYSGRGPIEAAGIGLEMKAGDIALRGNLGTVNEDGSIVDRRAGRITDVSELTPSLDGIEIDGIKFIVKAGTAHRAIVLMRGGDKLSSEILDNDPHAPDQPIRDVSPTSDDPKAKFTAKVLNKFLEKSRDILVNHPFNQKRVENGKLAANYLLLRGAGKYKPIQPLSEKLQLNACCIAGGGLYRGIGAFLGMDIKTVEGATALPNTDVHAKFRAAREYLKDYGFVFVHVKATDSLGEDGKWKEKKEFIEKIDKAIPDLLGNSSNDFDELLVFTADHSTPCCLKSHSADSVPIVFCGPQVRPDSVSRFSERDCSHGGLGIMFGNDVIPHVANLIGNIHLLGG